MDNMERCYSNIEGRRTLNFKSFSMINFINPSKEKPFLLIKEKYHEALKKNQKNIEAISIASYSRTNSFVDSRYVNLKIIDGENFIFFSNYESPKSKQFDEHNQISALIFWNTINTQIRINGSIKRTDKEFNQLYFSKRNLKKNALAISSNQSKLIESYEYVKARYNEVLESNNLNVCPDYWGGFVFSPSTIEIWQGEENRLNKREKFTRNNGWEMDILSP
jgi:pyridoxamine 5'-phosphate oxidase